MQEKRFLATKALFVAMSEPNDQFPSAISYCDSCSRSRETLEKFMYKASSLLQLGSLTNPAKPSSHSILSQNVIHGITNAVSQLVTDAAHLFQPFQERFPLILRQALRNPQSLVEGTQ